MKYILLQLYEIYSASPEKSVKSGNFAYLHFNMMLKSQVINCSSPQLQDIKTIELCSHCYCPGLSSLLVLNLSRIIRV